MRTAQKGRFVVLFALSLLGGGLGLISTGPAAADAPAIGLSLDPESGDIAIPASLQGEHVPPDKVLTATSDSDSFTMNMGATPCTGATCEAVVEIDLPTGVTWGTVTAGTTYPAALTAGEGVAKLHVHEGDSACPSVVGTLTIIDSELTAAIATKVVAQFEQHCGDAEDPALFGMVSFNGAADDPWYARTVTPDALAFGGVREGTEKQLTVELAKDGGSDLLDPSAFTITSATEGVYEVDPGNCEGAELSATCTMTITFSPPEDKSYSAILSWTDELSPSGRSVPISGFGTSSEVTVINAQNGRFGEQRAGTFSEPGAITVSNVGTDDVVFGEPEVTDFTPPASFAIDDGCANATLKTGQSCVIQVVAYPNAPFSRTATLELNHNASNGHTEVPLSVIGTGGYFIAEVDGTVHEFGDAVHQGDMNDFDVELNAPILGITTTSTGDGYWMVGADGGIFNFGDARFFGSTGSIPLNEPVLDMEAEVDDSGYWLVASDGGVFAFEAPFHGSRGGQPLNAPVVGITVRPDGSGYWLVAEDGGVFSYNAPFFGSMGGQPMNAPIMGMAATADGNGYWFVGADGGVFNYGTAGYFGSAGGKELSAPVVAIEPTPTGQGYWLLQADGVVLFYGDAADYGDGEGDFLTLGMAGTAPPVNPAGAGAYSFE